MNAMLLALTAIALAAAAGFGWLAWHLRAEERRRSDARVAALTSAIDGVEAASRPGARAAHTPVAVNSLFASEHSAAARGAPVIKTAVGVTVGLVLVVAIAMNNRGAVEPAAADRRPLELMSMRHEREGDTLTVSGFVRNPRNGNDMAGVTAVVFAFNRAGAFVTSARASLDFPKLEPGDESPFVVTIPRVADVGRYRVSFRTGAGVVQHVDRRAEQTRLATLGR